MGLSCATSRHILLDPSASFLGKQDTQFTAQGFVEQTVSWKAAVNGIQRVDESFWRRQWAVGSGSFFKARERMVKILAPSGFAQCTTMRPPAGVWIKLRSITDAEAVTQASRPSSRSAFMAFDQMESPVPTSRMLVARSMTSVSTAIRRRATAAASPPIPAPITKTNT